MSDIEFELSSPKDILPGAEIKGKVKILYPGRYDGVVISAQISDSNDHVTYKSCNGKPITQNVARLFIDRNVITGNKAEFTAVIQIESKAEHEVKFRAAVIEQHKEIDSSILFARYVGESAAD